jgi:hypothetical protein
MLRFYFFSVVLLFCTELYAQDTLLDSTGILQLKETEELLLSGDLHIQNLYNDTLLVVDRSQSRIILYTDSGEPVFWFGRTGNGPGDLNKPTSALLLPNGTILTTEFGGRITVFSKSGEVINIVTTPVNRLNKSHLLPSGNVLLTGNMYATEDRELLYLFDPVTMVILKRFFPLPVDPAEYAMQPLTLAEASFATVCEDKIIAAHSMLPELFFFDFEGEPMGRKVIDSELFSTMRKVKNRDNIQEVMENFGEASWIQKLLCLDEGYIGLTYHRNLIEDDQSRNSFMLLDRNGTLLHETTNLPNLLFNIHGSDTLFLQQQESSTPNTFIKAIIKKEY